MHTLRNSTPDCFATVAKIQKIHLPLFAYSLTLYLFRFRAFLYKLLHVLTIFVKEHRRLRAGIVKAVPAN